MRGVLRRVLLLVWGFGRKRVAALALLREGSVWAEQLSQQSRRVQPLLGVLSVLDAALCVQLIVEICRRPMISWVIVDQHNLWLCCERQQLL